MSGWRCLICGVRFDAPVVCVTKENLDGESGWETRREERCPKCGGDDIEEDTDSEQDAERAPA